MRVLVLVATIFWAALNNLGTVMDIPDELRIDASNKVRWLSLLTVLLAITWIKYPRYFSINYVKGILGVGISWERKGWYFLGMSGHSGIIEVTGFQFRGFNNSKKPLKNARPVLLLSNGTELPLMLQTPAFSSVHVAAIDPRCTFMINGSFGQVLSDQFIASNDGFTLKMDWDGGNLTIPYSGKKIREQIQRFKKDSTPKPDSFLR